MRASALLHRVAAAASLGLAALLSGAGTASAQDFELHPANIDGTVQVGSDVVLTSGGVSASAYDPDTGLTHSASTTLVLPSGGGSSGTYHLTVEAGASGLTYTVYAWAYASGGSYIQLSFPGGSAAVTEGNTTTLDFLQPGYHLGTVNMTVTVTGDATLQAAYANFSSYDSTTGISTYANGSISSSGSGSMLAGPGSVNANASATLLVGGVSAGYYLGSTSFSLASGGSASIAFSIHIDAVDPGSISGSTSFDGWDGATIYVQAYGGSPWQSHYTSTGGGGPYTFDPANAGSWTVYGYAYESNADGSYTNYNWPSKSVTVAAGQDVTGVDFHADAALIEGNLGTGDWRDPYSSNFTVYAWSDHGASASQSWNYYSGGTFPENPDYCLYADGGHAWTLGGAYLNNYYYNDDFTASSSLYVSASIPGASPMSLDAGETASIDVSVLDFQASSVTLHLTVAGGGTLQNPQVSFSGYGYDEDGNYQYYSYGNGYAYTPSPVEEGTVTVVMAPGIYTIQAYAYVDGSWTSFGQLVNFEVLPGDDIDQDLDAPSLALDSPAPQAEVECHEDVTVSGTVSDPSGVASVTVNGVEVTVGGDGSFSTTLTDLPEGENTVSVTAIDTQGNTITLNRTFTVLECADEDVTPPVITGSASPAPNEYGWTNGPVTVCFEATDESGIASLTPCTTLASDGAGQSVTGTATDPSGNSASATVGGINIDTTAPVVSASATPGCLWPPNHKMVPIVVTGSVSDLSGARAIQGFTVSSSEKDDDRGDGRTAGDCNGRDGYTAPAVFPATIGVDGAGTFTFGLMLRAERSGTGAAGRTYSVRFTVVDLAGNSTPVAVTVCVPHNQPADE